MAGNIVIKLIQKNWKFIAGFLGGSAATGVTAAIIYKKMKENAKNEGFKLGYEEASKVYNEVVKQKVRELELYKGDFSNIRKEYEDTINNLVCLIRSLKYELDIEKKKCVAQEKKSAFLEEMLDDRAVLLKKYAKYTD